jgi:predicted RNase H-like HicB family nuclease
MQQKPAVDDARRATAQVLETQAQAADVWRDGEWFVARARGVEVASQGKTRAEAIANLREALELHFEDPVATPPPE